MKRILAIVLVLLLSALIIFPAISQSNQSAGHSYSIKSEKTNYTIGITPQSHQPAVVVSSRPYSTVKYGALFQPEAKGVGETAKSSVIGLSTPSDTGMQARTNTSAASNAPKFSIQGMVYNDQNGNGKMDYNETGLANWTINLEQPVGNVVSKTVTDNNGRYGFSGLASGEYAVSEVLNKGWSLIAPPNGKYAVNFTGKTTMLDFGNKIMPTPIQNATAISNVTSSADVALEENASLS